VPTQQEIIDQNIRVLLGDLQLQLLFAKAQIQTMETYIADINAKQKQEEPVTEAAVAPKTNGAAHPIDQVP
jgi:hypothetical protein